MFDRVRDGIARGLSDAAQRFGTSFDERRATFEDGDGDHRRWLLTTCLAGVAGTFVLGGVLLGVVGWTAAPNGAFASIRPAPQESAVLSKADSGGGLLAAASLQPHEDSALPPDDDKALIIPERDLGNDTAYPGITSDVLLYGDQKTAVLESEIAVGAIATENITTIRKTPPPEPVDETVVLAKGDTLADALIEKGVTAEAANALIAAIGQVYPPKSIKPGTRIEITLDQQQDFYGRSVIFPVAVSFKTGDRREVVVEADEDGAFIAKLDGETVVKKAVAVNQFRTKAKVGASLYGTAKDHKIPDYIVAELTRVFSYDVDFQRQVKATDTFEVFYGAPLTGTSKKRKVLHFAQLTLGGQTKTYYRYTSKTGQTDFFDEKGRGAQKALLRTPVSGAKLTSRFGMRRHPLLGYSRMHTGVDFGAAYGTPIRAAGSGTVEVAGRNGAYGITAKIQHNGKYETLYAHMSRLAKGVRRGARVNQGQIIGYVGSTGRSTGPHLHYEVRVNDRAVNPTRLKTAGGKQLAGRELQNFRKFKGRIEAMMRTAPSATQVARAD